MVECFDPESSQLVLPGRGRIAVTADVVSDILGLPNSGDEVKYEFDMEAINFIHEEYGIEKGVAPHIDTIMDRVRDNKEADDDFFRSWLMIVVSTFLCPCTHLTISPRCYPPLVDLARAKDLNWCQFVVDQLKDAAQMIDKKNSVMGCLFLLVILYLDSLEMGNVDIPETKPRIAAWNWKLLDEVIKLDTNQDGTFGKLKLKGRDRQGNSVIQDSLFQMDDIRRFVSSNVSKRMTDQKKRKLTDAVAKFFGGFTELVGNFLEQVSEGPGICEAGPFSTQRQPTRTKRARRNASVPQPNEDSEPNEDLDSNDDSDYVDSGHDYSTEGWESDDSEGLETDIDDDSDKDASVVEDY